MRSARTAPSSLSVSATAVLVGIVIHCCVVLSVLYYNHLWRCKNVAENWESIYKGCYCR